MGKVYTVFDGNNYATKDYVDFSLAIEEIVSRKMPRKELAAGEENTYVETLSEALNPFGVVSLYPYLIYANSKYNGLIISGFTPIFKDSYIDSIVITVKNNGSTSLPMSSCEFCVMAATRK